MLPRQVRHGPAADLMTGESRQAIDQISQLIGFRFVPPPQVVSGIRHVNYPLARFARSNRD